MKLRTILGLSLCSAALSVAQAAPGKSHPESWVPPGLDDWKDVPAQSWHKRAGLGRSGWSITWMRAP